MQRVLFLVAITALIAIGFRNQYGLAAEPLRDKDLREFISKYWPGQFDSGAVSLVRGGGPHFTLRFERATSFRKGDTSLTLSKGSIVEFNGDLIYSVETKSPGCKVGDLEAVEGTTIEFWEADHNLIRALVTSKPVRLRGYTWPAKSKLLFYIDEKINPILYAVVLGGDLKGTEYKVGQKVYIGKLGDPDAQKSGPLSLNGQDPTL